jgi:hypothetical protein
VVDLDGVPTCEMILQGAAGNIEAAGDLPLGETFGEEPTYLSHIDVTGHGRPPRVDQVDQVDPRGGITH